MSLSCQPAFCAQWTSVNLVSGSAGTGNVTANTNFNRHDRYVCADVNWTKETQTCENVLIFQTTGSDVQLGTPGCSAPLGDLIVRTYTSSTNTMSSSPTTVWTDATYALLPFLAVRNSNESFFRIFFQRTTRASSCNTGTSVYMMKSTDLTASSWSTPVEVIAGSGSNEFGGWLDTQDGNHAIVIFSDLNNSGKTALYKTTDNGETFSYYSSITGTSGNNPLGSFVNEPGTGRVLGILRQQSDGVLKIVRSSDWGLTWSAILDSNIGVSGSNVNVAPQMTLSAGNRGRVTVSFYNRVLSRFLISSPTLFENAFNGEFVPTYLIGTSSDGNGGMFVLNADTHKYIISTDTTATPNSMNWWVGQDIYSPIKIQSKAKLYLKTK